VSKKLAAKKVKPGPSKTPSSKSTAPPPKSGHVAKVGVVKISRPKAKPGLRGTSEIELALMKPTGVSKKYRLLDVAALPHAPRTTCATTIRTAQVPTFYNLSYNLSLDTRAAPLPGRRIEKHASSPKRTIEERAFPPPSVFGEFLPCMFALLTRH
jgi:hypothetical protein